MSIWSFWFWFWKDKDVEIVDGVVGMCISYTISLVVVEEISLTNDCKKSVDGE